MTVKIGIIGFGFMGAQHLRSYDSVPDAKVVAICDANPEVLKGGGGAAGNVGDADAVVIDPQKHRLYGSASELLADPDIDAVDICVPTQHHASLAEEVMRSGKHMIIEKPLAMERADMDRILEGSKKAKGQTMCAMCIRFWPEWAWLKKQIDKKTYGETVSVILRRFSSAPGWAPWLLDASVSGSALFDLHIHDTDFMTYLFGIPEAVTSVGATGKVSKGIDQVVTQYYYPASNVQVAAAEGGWNADPTYGFTMRYTAVFEKATIDYDLARDPVLLVHKTDGTQEAPKIPASDGWTEELRYFTDCIAKGKTISNSTIAQAHASMIIVHAEAESVKKREKVVIREP